MFVPRERRLSKSSSSANQSTEFCRNCKFRRYRSAERPREKFKTTEFEAMRLFLSAGKELKEHKVDGSITLQCLEGRVEFRFDGETRVMMPGDWLYLVGGVSHSLFAQENASLLLTIMLRSGSAIASD